MFVSTETLQDIIMEDIVVEEAELSKGNNGKNEDFKICSLYIDNQNVRAAFRGSLSLMSSQKPTVWLMVSIHPGPRGVWGWGGGVDEWLVMNSMTNTKLLK